MKTYEGIITALVTPLDTIGNVDENGLEQLIDFQLKNKIHGLLILGGTGEYCALSKAERVKAIKIAVKKVNGAVPVMVGILETGINDAIEMGKAAKEAGADSLLVVTPYYVKPTQQGLIDYYQILDKAVDMPLFLYNIPYKTGVNIEPETVEAIAEKLPNVVGIKDCTPDLGQIINLINRVGDKISIFCGEEFYSISEFILGVRGAIMATANVIPDVWVKMWHDVQNKAIDDAVQTNAKYYPFFKVIFKEGNPGPLKLAMNIADLPSGSLSTPLIQPSPETSAELHNIMESLGINRSAQI